MRRTRARMLRFSLLISLGIFGCLAEFPAPPQAGTDARPGVDQGEDGPRPVVDRGPLLDPLMDAARRDQAVRDATTDGARPPDASAPQDATLDAALALDAARPAADTAVRDLALPADTEPPRPDVSEGVPPDAGPACEPLFCASLPGEPSTSPCAAGPTFNCDFMVNHELCQCGQRDAGLYFLGTPGSGEPLSIVAYVYRPADQDPGDVRLALDGACLAPARICPGLGACAGHQAVVWRLREPLRGGHNIEIFHHTACNNVNRQVANVAFSW